MEQVVSDAIASSTIISYSTSAISLFGSGNPTMAVCLLDTGQSISNMQLINRKNTGMFEESTKSFYKSNPSELFPNPAQSWAEADSDTKARLLSTVSVPAEKDAGVSSKDLNAKLLIHGKTPYFLVNAFNLVLLHAIAWGLVLISKLIKMLFAPLRAGSISERLYYAFSYNILILVFMLTAQEFLTLCFYQFQFITRDSKLAVGSSIASLLVLIYYTGFTAYYVNTVLTGELFKSATSLKKFAVFSYLFKCSKIKYRLFPIVYILKKALTSLVLVFAFRNAEWQTILNASVQFAYWYYLFLFNPIKKEFRIFKVLITTVESEVLLLNIWYCITVISSNQNSLASEIELTKWSIYILLLIQLTYMLFGMGFVVQLALKLIGKYRAWRRSKNTKHPKAGAGKILRNQQAGEDQSLNQLKGPEEQKKLEISFDDKSQQYYVEQDQSIGAGQHSQPEPHEIKLEPDNDKSESVLKSENM